jgi:glutaredoxin
MEVLMAKIEIYYKSWCPYSHLAMDLMRRKGISFIPIDLTHDTDSLEREMRRRSGQTSVPQVFINDRNIGGFDEIAKLDARGQLDPLLSCEARPRAA